MNLGGKKGIFVYYFLPFCIIIVLIGGVAYPLFLGVQQKISKIVSIKKEEKIIGSIKYCQEKEDIRKDIEKINSIFIDGQAPINLIQFWEKTARENDLLLDVNSISLKSNKKDLWKSIGFQINLVGNYVNFLKFLEKIEYGPFLMKTQRITINLVKKEKLDKEKKEIDLSDDNLIKAVVVTKVFVK